MSTDRCDAAGGGDPSTPPTRSWLLPLGLDLGVVVLFALLGRIAHGEGSLVTGTMGTAAPFVLGLLAGWLRAPCAGMPTAQRAQTVRFGWWLLAWTLGGGMVLRWLLGEGVAPAFVLVSTAVLAAGLVGRRFVIQRWAPRQRVPAGT